MSTIKGELNAEMTTQEQIIAAGFEHFEQFPDDYKQKLIALFEAGRVAEREECANILEAQDVDPSFKHRMADAIRTRGNRK